MCPYLIQPSEREQSNSIPLYDGDELALDSMQFDSVSLDCYQFESEPGAMPQFGGQCEACRCE